MDVNLTSSSTRHQRRGISSFAISVCLSVLAVVVSSSRHASVSAVAQRNSLTVPLAVWTTPNEDNSKIYKDIVSLGATSSTTTKQSALDVFFRKFTTHVTSAATRQTPALYTIFVDKDLDTSSFLQVSGGFGESSNKDAKKYNAFRTFLLSSGTAKHSESFVEEYVYPAPQSALLTFMSRLADDQHAPSVTYITDKSSDASSVKSISSKISVASFDDKHFELSPSKTAVVVVNMSTFKSGTMSQGQFVVDFFNRIGDGSKSKVGVFTSTTTMLDESVVVQRRLQADDTPVQSELRIQPFQLAALLTLGFVSMMIVLMVTCLASIDVPAAFEDKTIPINKEY